MKGIWHAQHAFRITVFVLCIVIAGAVLAWVINPPTAPPPAQVDGTGVVRTVE